MIKELFLSIALTGTIGLGANNSNIVIDADKSFFGSVCTFDPVNNSSHLVLQWDYYTLFDNIPKKVAFVSYDWADYDDNDGAFLNYYIYNSSTEIFDKVNLPDETYYYTGDELFEFGTYTYYDLVDYIICPFRDGYNQYFTMAWDDLNYYDLIRFNTDFCLFHYFYEDLINDYFSLTFNNRSTNSIAQQEYITFIDFFTSSIDLSFFNSVGYNGLGHEEDYYYFTELQYIDYSSFTDISYSFYPYATLLPRYDVSNTQDYYQSSTYCDNFFVQDNGTWSDGLFPLYVDNDPNVGTTGSALEGYSCRYHFEFKYVPDLNLTYSFSLRLRGFSSGYINRGSYYFSDLTTAYNNGFYEGKQEGDREGYNRGYQNGYNQGVGQGDLFWALFGGIADTPVLMVKSLFNFELFGVDLFGVILTLLTGVIVITIIRKIL